MSGSGPMGVQIMETAVLSEIVKTLTHRGMVPTIHFWCTSAGSGVDILVESAGKLVPIDVKLAATPRPATAASIKTFQEDPGETTRPGYVVYPGDVRLPLGSNVMALLFNE